MSVAIKIERISKAYRGTHALNRVSLDIEPGELFFLLGPSGCGKTTLLRCIAGFCEPDEGAVWIGGRDVTRVPPNRRETGMVFQSYALWPHMTVHENVAFGLEVRRVSASERDRRVGEALDLVRLSGEARRRPNQLSGGQQQRVALARALVIRPQCLLLDEPLSNLDAKLRMEMRAEIRRICKQSGITTLYVTHDQKEALSIADRLAILDRGKVRQCGPPQEVYLHPNSRFVAGFISETNLVCGRIVRRIGGFIEAETPLGALTAAAPPDLKDSGEVRLSLRPEILRLDPPPPGTVNVIEGVLRDTAYLGELAQHQVAVKSPQGGETELRVYEMNPSVVARDQAAHPCKVWFRPEDAVALPE